MHIKPRIILTIALLPAAFILASLIHPPNLYSINVDYSKMKIAIAGAGDVAAYFIEEFSQSPHETVVLSRSLERNSSMSNIEIRTTDYTVDNLKHNIQDCDAIVSTLAGPNEAYVASHLAILEACIQSPRCKRFIPSGWTINMEDFPDQPLYLSTSRNAVLKALRAQSEVKWSFMCNYWFMDYILPASNRLLKDIGNEWIMNYTTNVFDLYGNGLQEITLTSARDTAQATLALLQAHDIPWSDFTHLSGQTLTPRELFALLKRHDPSWSLRNITLTDVLRDIIDTNAVESGVSGVLRLVGFTNCGKSPSERTLQWNTGILAGVHGRDVETFLADGRTNRVP